MTDRIPASWWRRLRNCSVILVVGWLIYAVWMHFLVWDVAREVGHDNDKLTILPTPLTDVSIAKLSGLRIDRFGFSFLVPWDTAESNRGSKSAESFGFKGGAFVLIFDTASAVNTIQMERGATASDQATMNRMLGPKALRSNYDLMAAAVRATPSNVKWWESRAHNAGAMLLLENKSVELAAVKSIHPVTLGSVRGFQFGDPDVAPCVVSLKLFDDTDRRYWIVINAAAAHHQVITQSEINGLIASLKRDAGN